MPGRAFQKWVAGAGAGTILCLLEDLARPFDFSRETGKSYFHMKSFVCLFGFVCVCLFNIGSILELFKNSIGTLKKCVPGVGVG